MLIPNKFLKLDYNPTIDVLLIEWPNMHEYTLPEVHYIIDEVVGAVKHYDIKRILNDTRNSEVLMGMHEYAQIVYELAIKLGATRLEKFAKLLTTDPNRETVANNAAALVSDTIQYRAFGSLEEALDWLTARSA